MNHRTDDFFLPANTVRHVAEEDYEKAALLVSAAQAFARSTYQCVYVIDYFRREFLYVSDNLATLCGVPADRIRDFGYRLYLDHVSPAEQEMLLELNRKGFEL